MKNLLFASALFLSTLGSAQISISGEAFLTQADTVRLSSAAAGLEEFDFFATGENLTWDFSNIPVEEQREEFFVDPNNSGYKLGWCLSNFFVFNCDEEFDNLTNIAQRNSQQIQAAAIPASDIVRHQKLTATTYEEKMVGVNFDLGGIALPLTFEYENPDTLLQFPLTFGATDSNSSRVLFDLTASGLDIVSSQNATRTNTVDGWGSLTTPYGDFPDVLRMRTVVNRMDTTTFNGAEIPMPSTTVEYKWYAPGHGLPVLQATSALAGDIEAITNISYLDSLRCLNAAAEFFSTPFMPVVDADTHLAQVDFNNLSTNSDVANWDFGDGSTSTAFAPSHDYICAGDYTVTLIASNSGCPELPADTIQSTITISNPVPSEPVVEQVSICAGETIQLGGQTISAAGMYQIMEQDEFGCDVLVVYDVALLETDFSVSVTGNTLISDLVGDTYQWIDCADNSEIDSANGPSYSPAQSGIYAVEVTTQNCAALSSCQNIIVSDIEDLIAVETVVFPNPFVDKIYIESTTHISEITLYSAEGKMVKRTAPAQSLRTEIATQNLAKGVYSLVVKNGNLVERRLVVKQ